MILITGQGRQPEVWGRSQHGHARRVSRRRGRGRNKKAKTNRRPALRKRSNPTPNKLLSEDRNAQKVALHLPNAQAVHFQQIGSPAGGGLEGNSCTLSFHLLGLEMWGMNERGRSPRSG